MAGLMSEVGEMEQMPTIANDPPATDRFSDFSQESQSTVRNVNRQQWPCSRAGGEHRRAMSSSAREQKVQSKLSFERGALVTCLLKAIKQCSGHVPIEQTAQAHRSHTEPDLPNTCSSHAVPNHFLNAQHSALRHPGLHTPHPPTRTPC